MASLRTLVSPNRRAAARLVAQSRRQIQKALALRPHVKRTEIAQALGVHRSVITKQINGTQDMSLSRVGEIAWALGFEAEMILHDVSVSDSGNAFDHVSGCPAFDKVTLPPKTAGNKVRISTHEYEAA